MSAKKKKGQKTRLIQVKSDLDVDNTLEIEVRKDMTVAELKREIRRQGNLYANSQRIVFDGAELEDDSALLSDLKMKHGCEVHVLTED
jgi:Ubiquitin family